MLPQIDDTSLAKFYEITISISGVLFPIFQALLLFIIEKSFNRLEFSRQSLIDFYFKIGKIITLGLAYLILQSLFQIIKFNTFSFWFLCIFTFLILIFRLDLLKYSGYWNTLHSSHYIPEKASKLKKYIITLWNNRFVEKFQFLVFLIIIFLPFAHNYSIFWSVFTILIYLLFQIFVLLSNPILFQKKLLEIENTNGELIDETLNWGKQKIEAELQIIKNTLISNNYKIQEYLVNNNFKYLINPQVRENGELFIVIVIKDLKINSIEELKKQIYIITKGLFVLLSETVTDINSFAFSFNLTLNGNLKNLFVRSNKNEISSHKNKQPEEFVKSLKNKLIDDVLK